MDRGIESYTKKFRSSFKTLHKEVFPETYFNRDMILNRLNESNNLLLAKKNDNEIKGYVYVESNSKHHESNIEYIAVAKEYRKEGVGKSLLIGAINNIFSHPEIEDITICVSGENDAAINLYKSVGLSVKYILNSYDITVDKSYNTRFVCD
ncbi:MULTISPECIES: GNAT family N-acetyltransferase [Virgibacillus]|uniref:Ribosomal protein S18 acetylase RimI n=1 Tax=Virgibacillus chiguensis TaxID=411959 RepID=A0A1M5XG47_9BACI|nr:MULTISPECIES: N-acetyltransferase [Virgibacillus]SHH98800.1 Ribosomal protein S18 acetylase RimI [Virgibacillus chiguensis]